MAKKRTLVDLTQEIYQGMPVYPGHAKTVIWNHHTHDETRGMFPGGFSYTTRGLLLCDHGPTHVDAINHINPAPNAPSIDALPLHLFYTEAICLDLTHISPDGFIGVADLEAALKKAGLKIKEGDTVLLWTGHYDRQYGKEDWLRRYAGLTKEATEWLCDHGVVNVGIDAPSIDNPKERSYPAHCVCRDRQLVNTENMANLGRVAGKRFMFAGFPLKIRDGSGSPIRAVAILEEE